MERWGGGQVREREREREEKEKGKKFNSISRKRGGGRVMVKTG